MLRPLYPQMFHNLIQGSLLLKQELSSKGFEIYEPTDLGIVLFRTTDHHNMGEYKALFGSNRNVRFGKITLVTTEIGDDIYFRIVVFDPNIINYYQQFVSELVKEYNEYAKIVNIAHDMEKIF